MLINFVFLELSVKITVCKTLESNEKIYVQVISHGYCMLCIIVLKQ